MHTEQLRLRGLVHGCARRWRRRALPCTLWPRDPRFLSFDHVLGALWRGKWIGGRLGIEGLHLRFVLCHNWGFSYNCAGEDEDGFHTPNTTSLSLHRFLLGRSCLSSVLPLLHS